MNLKKLSNNLIGLSGLVAALAFSGCKSTPYETFTGYPLPPRYPPRVYTLIPVPTAPVYNAVPPPLPRPSYAPIPPPPKPGIIFSEPIPSYSIPPPPKPGL